MSVKFKKNILIALFILFISILGIGFIYGMTFLASNGFEQGPQKYHKQTLDYYKMCIDRHEVIITIGKNGSSPNLIFNIDDNGKPIKCQE